MHPVEFHRRGQRRASSVLGCSQSASCSQLNWGLFSPSACVLLSHFSRVQLFVTPMECSPPGSSVLGVSQARVLKWVTTSFYRGSSQLTDQTCISYTAGEFFTIKPPTNAGDMRRGFSPWVRKIPWRRTWHLTPAFLPGEPQGQRSLEG